MYYALHTLSAPGTIVAGYQRGHEVPEPVVEAWGLVVGTDEDGADVSEQAPTPDAPVPVVPRPGPGDNRATWENYARSRGMSAEDAAAASQEELEAAGDSNDSDGAADDYPRPADSAKKAEWVHYVHNHPQATVEDKGWASDDATTKAELQAWTPDTPVPGDTVAVNAAEQANG